MVCHPCRKQAHEQCTDLPRRKAAKKGEIIGMSDPMASRWCDCACLPPVTPALPVKEVSE
jgi:hypothetical protein